MAELYDNIISHNSKETVRFHMPGHKGRNFPGMDIGIDTTELRYSGNLLYPAGRNDPALSASRYIKACAERYLGVKAGAVVSCGGATLCIQTAVAYLVSRIRGGIPRIICDRNAHVSLIYALALCGAEPVWVYRDENGYLPPGAIEEAVRMNANLAGVFVTSPDYYGKMQDIASVKAACGDLPLVVDNAHGSHLMFCGNLHPMLHGADITIDSAHKTLPVLTGGAYLLCREISSEDEILRFMRLFASTSPSFTILCSIERCFEIMLESGIALHSALHERTESLYESINTAIPGIIDRCDDPFRIVLNAYSAGTDGEKMYDYLYENKIVCEFSDRDRVVLIPSVANTDNDFERLYDAIARFPVGKARNEGVQLKYVKAEQVAALREAVFAPSETVPVHESGGRICARPAIAYPPGVPVVVPGEIIGEILYKNAELLNKYGISAFEVMV